MDSTEGKTHLVTCLSYYPVLRSTHIQTLKDGLSPVDLIIKHFIFKSQGSLEVCVAAFRKWHREQVDAIESMKYTDIPTVKTLLVCHSMGGIVAVDSLLSMIDSNDPIHASVLGILAYDTPYFGLNPPVIHRTISTQVNTISSAVDAAREWVPQSLFSSKPKQATVADRSAKSGWGFGKTIAALGVGVAAVGALSYLAKDPIVNHLQFVSVLYKPDDLARRMKRLSEVKRVGFAVFYTVVTKPSDGGGERTFCNLPVDKSGCGRWIRQENGLAKDEVEAHCGIFSKSNNDHYENMSMESLGIIKDWIGA